jgi:NADH-quinone oxidoreductase subunit J
VPEIIFYLIALSVCVFAVLTVTARLIFHSAVWLSLCLLSVAGLYFYLNAGFLGVIQVLVYIGGIITLFIFAIKLTARIDDPSIRQANRQTLSSALVAGTLLAALVHAAVFFSKGPPRPGADLTIKDLGKSLMTTCILPFEFISVLLLAVMIGAIVIGRARK